MAELDELKTAVQQSTEFWKSGRVLEALHMLDDLIAKAAEETGDLGEGLGDARFYDVSSNRRPQLDEALL